MINISADIELNILSVMRDRHYARGAMYTMQAVADVLDAIGTKEEPDVIEDYAVHSDGIFLEYALPAPVTNADDFYDSLSTGRRIASERSGMNTLRREEHLLYVDTVRLSQAELAAIDAIGGRIRRQYRTFGCKPDYQVNIQEHRGDKRKVPDEVVARPLRECGGHIHLDLPKHVIESEQTAKMVHFFETLLIENRVVTTDIRRYNTDAWYRRLGTYRPKEYGFEYRTLPPSWCRHKHSVTAVVRAGEQLLRMVA